MHVELHDPETPDIVVATAAWDGAAVVVSSDDDVRKAAIERAFRTVPVVVDDGAYRQQGTSGAVVVQPGDLAWFRAVSSVRVPVETGLAARLVPGIDEGGYDPAAQYRSFSGSIERLSGVPDRS